MNKIQTDNFVLGLWDGHDAGASLFREDQIIFAINEERLSRRKLDVGFPFRSIKACLDYAGISANEIKEISISTNDPAKTLTRLVPKLKEEYYLIRRRKKEPGRLDPFKKKFKYWFTELGPGPVSRYLSKYNINKELRKIGFINFNLSFYDHHFCHAQTAARFSGFKECLVITLDGVGDGLSGSIWKFDNGDLKLVKKISSKVSFGIFFEHITNLMNMRELEDEGKVMALANYAYPLKDSENPLMDLINVQGLELVSKYNSLAMFQKLKKILWHYPSEQFAFMAQRALEKNAIKLTKNALKLTGMKKLTLAGGVFSNIKLNMKIAELDEIENVFAFPHMGDGGLAIGAAVSANYDRFNVSHYALKDLYYGPQFSEKEILSSLNKWDFKYRKIKNPGSEAANLILNGEIILWFQGRMEIGPRALGNRSILARPDSKQIKDKLNLVLKKRVWYQPFCPSILMEDADSLLEINGQNIRDNRFMTTGFRIYPKYLDLMEGVINIDGTCRPQFVGDENPVYKDLLMNIKKELGIGVVLNTSFNIHGEPIVCSPDDALDMFAKTKIKYLFTEDFLVEKDGS
ncbi:carbamoyltransferase [Candidatus Magnetomoraceae bacterium gMMP-15]